MTLSPVENAHLTLAGLRGFAGALVTAAALCLEPLARRASVDPIRYRAVWLAELAVGLALAAAVLVDRHARTAQD